MISTIKVHQPPPTPNPATRGATTLPTRRLEHLQYLDLTDCASMEDTGLKMVVESCPQLLYLFLRRCTSISGKTLCKGIPDPDFYPDFIFSGISGFFGFNLSK